jgi:hypothetical protein
MLKRLAIITVLVILSAYCPNKSGAQSQNDPKDEPSSPVTIVDNSTRQNQTCGASKKMPEPHAEIEYSQWALVFIAALTGWAVFNQARAATKAAKSAEASASALVNSERAWVMANVRLKPQLAISFDLRDAHIDIDIDLINAGRTPAWVYEQRVQMVIETDPPLVPQFLDGAVVIDGTFPVVQNQPAVTSAALVSAEGSIPDPSNGMHIYIFGIVRYRDTFSPSRETYFGYVIRGNNRLERIPNEAYNKHT